MKHSKRRLAIWLAFGSALWLGLVFLAMAVGVFGFGPEASASGATRGYGSDESAAKNLCGAGEIRLNVWFGDWCIEDIVDYTRKFYTAFMGAIGIFAAAMIMYAGYQWITASGNAEKISRAKDGFTSALVGVILALISWVLLNLINPMITSLQITMPETITGVADTSAVTFCEDKLGPEWEEKVEVPRPNCGQPNTINEGGKQCYGKKCPGGSSCVDYNGTIGCFSLEQLCKETPANECRRIDDIIKQNNPTHGCARRFDETLIYLLGIEGQDECIYGQVITKDQWEAQNLEKIGCKEPPFENRCWKEKDGNKVPGCNIAGALRGIPILWELDPRMICCTNNTRPIRGANVVCVKKQGGDPGDPETYWMWGFP